jgi:hypothetical protein
VVPLVGDRIFFVLALLLSVTSIFSDFCIVGFCESLQEGAGIALELPDQKLEDLWFKLLSHGSFLNTSIRCSVK